MVLLIGLLCGCVGKQDISAAEALITKFRALESKGDFAAIYDLGSPEFKQAAKEDDFLQMMTSLQRKTQGCGAPTRIGWQTYSGTGGTKITETFQRTCPRGPFNETITVLMKDKTALLHEYNVASPLLMMPDPPQDQPI